MTDEDRPAAPDDGRPAPDDTGSDWFFRDRTQEDAQTYPTGEPDPDQYASGPESRQGTGDYGAGPGDHGFRATEFQSQTGPDPDATALVFTGTSVCQGLPERTRLEIDERVGRMLKPAELGVLLVTILASPPSAL